MTTGNERPIRILTFAGRPDVLLVTVPEGQEFFLPRMRAPFDRHTVAQALGSVELPAFVNEASATGRYGAPLAKDGRDEKAAAGQMHRQQEAARAVTITNSASATTTEKQRAELILEKQLIDDQLRNLKVEMGRAKALAATRGTYMPIGVYRAKEQAIVNMQAKSLAIQHRLGELKKRLHAENAAAREATEPSNLERFKECCRELLPEQQYLAIWAMVDSMG